MTRAHLLSKAMPSILGLLSTPRVGNLYSLWFKVRFGPKSGLTSLRTVVAESDFAALKSAFAQVLKDGKNGRLLGLTLIRENNRVDSGVKAGE